MAKFRLRSSNEIQDNKRVYFDDTKEDWIEMRPSMPRKDFYQFAGKASNSDVEDRILVSVDNLFKALVVGWSVVNPETDAKTGKEREVPVPPSIEALELLPLEFQTWIDRQVQEHFQQFTQVALPESAEKSETPAETSDSDEI